MAVTPTVATSADLGTLLGIGAQIDVDRANLVLGLAERKCARYVKRINPTKELDTDALDVILAVAVRGYNNITSAHQMGLSSANASFGAQNSTMGVGGLYLSRSDKADLRRFAGGTNAASVSLLPAGWPDQDAVTP